MKSATSLPVPPPEPTASNIRLLDRVSQISALKGGPARVIYFYLAIVVVSWAGNWPLMKLALADAPPFVFVLLRLVGTLALLVPLLPDLPPRLLARRAPLLPVTGERIGLFVVGQLQVAGFLICGIIGLAIVPAGRAI